MYKKIIILCLLLIPLNIKANPLSLQPDFSRNPLFVSKGTSLIPLCANPSSPYCFQNWTDQAIPLVTHGINGQRNINFFLPVFIPYDQAPKSQFANKGWKTYRSSISSTSSKRRLKDPGVQSKTSKPEDSSQKQEDQTEDKTVKQQQTISQKQDETSNGASPLPGQTEIQHKEGTDEFRIVTYLPNGEGIVLNEGTVAYINEEDIEGIPPLSLTSTTAP